MKKSLFITLGLLLILIVLAVWLYLLFFGTPNNKEDVFTDLGIGSPSVEIDVNQETPEQTEDDVTLINTQNKALQQLTTRPVAGFGFVGSSSDLIRYAERGTGHIFEIDTQSGIERKISGTTVPRVVEAVFSDSAKSVALTSESGYRNDIVAGFINENENKVDFINLPSDSFDPFFVSDSLLRYAVKSDGGVDGFELDTTTDEPVRIFSIPLRDVSVIWASDTYVYNNVSSENLGSLYKVTSKLEAQTPVGYGFVGGVTDSHFIGSAIFEDEYTSYAVERENGGAQKFALTYIPEKCSTSLNVPYLLWCASPFEKKSGGFIENWYKGSVQSQDLLWVVDLDFGDAYLHSDFLNDSGRLIDVNKISVDHFGTVAIFRNKVDDTLWIYDSNLE